MLIPSEMRCIALVLALLITSCSISQNKNDEIEVVYEYDDLQKVIEKNKNKKVVVNFWATTCPPCIKEMPHFNELFQVSDADKLKIILVSLDREKDLEKRVYPMVNRLKIQPEIVLLEDQNYSRWTALVDSSWYGAMPATLMLKGQKKKFRFGAYETFEELRNDVNSL